MNNKIITLALCLIFSNDYGCSNSEKENGDAGADSEIDGGKIDTESESDNIQDTETVTDEDSETGIEYFTCEDSDKENCITGYQVNCVDECDSWGISLAIGSDGMGVFAYIKDEVELALAHCKDLSCSEIEKNTVDKGGEYNGNWECELDPEYCLNACGNPTIKIGSDNMPIILYNYFYTYDDARIAYCDDMLCNKAKLYSIGPRGGYDVPEHDMEIGSDGLPLYVKSGINEADIIGNTTIGQISYCTDATCYYDYTAIEADGFPSITIGSDGMGLIGLSTSVSITMVHCGNVQCTTTDTYEVDTEGYIMSIATGLDGRGIMSLWRNEKLSIAHCKNIECSSVEVSELDEKVGWSSIAIGKDGKPIISYFDGENKALKIAHCQDSACKSAEINIVDTDNAYIDGPSIAIGSDGLPLIAYSSYGWIKILHCARADCAP